MEYAVKVKAKNTYIRKTSLCILVCKLQIIPDLVTLFAKLGGKINKLMSVPVSILPKVVYF